MIRARLGWTAAASLALAAAPAAARVVDYSIDEAGYGKAAAELKITPLAELSPPVNWRVELTAAPMVDHETMALGMYCSGKVENPISLMLKRMADRFAQPAAGQPARLTIEVTEARSYRRCIEADELVMRCITRVRLKGEAVAEGPQGSRRFPVAADVERTASVDGFCGGLARGIGTISRQAAIALINDAVAKADQPAAD